MRRKLMCVFAAFFLTVLSACGSVPEKKEDAPLKIIATIWPEYDWVLNVLGENPGNAEVTLLLDKGTDLHSYQPTAGDIMRISDCDVFIYVGGESDAWVEDVLGQAVNKNMKTVSLLEVLKDSVREEEITEGMQEEEHGHEDEEAEADEHVWLSLRLAAEVCTYLGEVFAEADPGHADLYRDNAAAYGVKLAALDEEYRQAVREASLDTFLFGDRFPFRYLADDLGLRYYAAFPGCSAETEASFETVTFLAGKVDELALPAVLTIEGSDQRIAATIVRNTKTKDQKILTMDSLQSAAGREGSSYLSAMENNLAVLKEALTRED